MRYLFAFITLISASVQAQQSDIDSLKEILPTVTDAQRAQVLNELSYKYLSYQPEVAKQYALEALKLSKKIGYVDGEMQALTHLGDYEFRMSNYAKVIEYGTLTIKIATQTSDSVAMADAYRLMGNVHTYGLKQYDEALLYQLKALRIYEKKGNKRKIAALDGSITWVYAITNQNLGEATRLAREGLALATELNDHQLISFNYNSLGLISFKKNKLDSAIYYLNKSNEEGSLAFDNAVITYNNTIIGNVLLAQAKYQQAITVFNEALKGSYAINLREARKDAYEGLAKGYSETKNFEKAFRYQIMFMQLRDSLVNWEITQKSLALKAGYEEEKREARIAELQNEKDLAHRDRKIMGVAFAIVICLFLLIGTLILRNNRQRRLVNEQLQEKNEEIETQNEELTQNREELARQSELVNKQNKALTQANETKDKLFSIVSHDLRGPIASLKSLLGLVIKGAVTVEEFQMMAPKLNQNVGTIHETLENLLQWSQSQMSGLKFSPVVLQVKSLVTRKLNLFSEAATAKHISLVDETPAGIQVFGDENQIRLILRNLINNAIKFTPDGGQVTIATIQKNNQVEISVRDTGIGIPIDRVAELFKPYARVSTVGTHGEKGTGLGLLLCHEMALKNNGTLSVTSDVGRGTTFTLSLPVA